MRCGRSKERGGGYFIAGSFFLSWLAAMGREFQSLLVEFSGARQRPENYRRIQSYAVRIKTGQMEM
jgi:hypothetical protein